MEMKKNVSRRNAIKAGAASAGIVLGAKAPAAEANVLPDVWGGDFMMQWSPPGKVARDLTVGPTPVRLSCQKYRLNNSSDVSLAEQVKAVREAGYTAAEAGSGSWKKMTDSGIRDLKAVLREHDVLFYNLHTWVNIIHPDMAKRAECQKHVCGAIEEADRLGMEFILTHTGGNSTTNNKDMPHPENWTKETWERSVAAMKQILRDTSGSKVKLAVEAVNSCNNNTPKSHVRLKEDVGDDRVGVCLDPVNMLHPGVVFRTTELINECFDLLGEDILYAHAKDIEWKAMLPSFSGVVLGAGTMDYELYLARLSRMKRMRVLYIEHLPDELYAPSKQYLDQTAARLGVKLYA
jgi:sugar phosphate isomerase/epimerase